MRFPNMSNQRSSRPISSSQAHRAAVGKLVADRIGRDWCLFLDRDGVINRRVVGDYVRSWRQFEWLPGAQVALKTLREWAPHLVVVTNQQGIGKGLMSARDVATVHTHLEADLAAGGVAIDGFAVCPHLESAGCACRKPAPGLVLDWLRRHPDTQPSLSIMVGDSESDLELARNVAAAVGRCVSIHIGRGSPGEVADVTFDSLADLAVAVREARVEQRS